MARHVFEPALQAPVAGDHQQGQRDDRENDRKGVDHHDLEAELGSGAKADDLELLLVREAQHEGRAGDAPQPIAAVSLVRLAVFVAGMTMTMVVMSVAVAVAQLPQTETDQQRAGGDVHPPQFAELEPFLEGEKHQNDRDAAGQMTDAKDDARTETGREWSRPPHRVSRGKQPPVAGFHSVEQPEADGSGEDGVCSFDHRRLGRGGVFGGVDLTTLHVDRIGSKRH